VWKIKLTLLLVSTMTIMSGTAIVASLPMIKDHFAGEANVDLYSRIILTAPAIAIAFFAPWTNMVASIFGKKRTLLIALFLFGLFGVMGAWMSSIIGMVISRLLFGLSVALMMSLSLAFVGDYFKDEERTSYLGYQNTFVALGGVVFMAGGGLLAQWSWQGAFYIYALGWIVGILAWRYLVEPPKPKPITQEEHKSVHVMRHWPIFATALAVMSVFYMVPTQLPYLLHDVYKMDASHIGFLIATVTFVSAVTSLFYARLRRHLDIRSIYTLLFAIQGSGFIGISFSKTYAQFNSALILVGIGVGFVIVNTNSWLLESAQAHERLKATGLLSGSLFLGQFISPLLLYFPTTLYGIQETFRGVGVVLILVSLTLLWKVLKHRYGRISL
jgi:MFS family permease